MTLTDIIITVVAVAIVGATLLIGLLDLKNGKSSCGCDCAHCSKSDKCDSKQDDTENKTDNN